MLKFLPIINFFCLLSYRLAIFITVFVIFTQYSGLCSVEISGSIAGMTLTEEGGPYIVVNDITIPAGESAVIGEGSRLFFKPFTSLIIEGNLTVSGTLEKPVVFSSINDSLSPERRDLLPNPFDWNGIHIKSNSSKVEMSNFILAYSVYGIKSQKESITIYNAMFRQNGQYNFTINDSPMPVADNIPYSYSARTVNYLSNGATSGNPPVDYIRYREGAVITILGNTGNLRRSGYKFAGWNTKANGHGESFQPGASIVIRKDDITLYAQWERDVGAGKSSFITKVVPTIIVAGGVGCGIFSVIQIKRWFDLGEEYRLQVSVEQRTKIQKEGDLSSGLAIGSGVVSVIGVTTGTMLYWFWNMKEDKRLVLEPMILPFGVGLTAVFEIKK